MDTLPALLAHVRLIYLSPVDCPHKEPVMRAFDYFICSYSETTWAVGIAQLTHHEVQGGGKNPETEGRGIFAPTADRVVS